MPVLSLRPPVAQRAQAPAFLALPPGDPEPILFRRVGRARPGWFGVCSNVRCASGWLHLLRGGRAPVFEGGWCCSAACTAAQVAAAVRREGEARGVEAAAHRHRVPLGLLMLERGWIAVDQLRRALEAQKAAGAGRIGDWLIRQRGASEPLVARALGLQWGCPVLPLDCHDAEAVTPFVPRIFLDAYGVLPLRVAVGRLLYLVFADRLDPVLALAVERMTGLAVESGLGENSLFRAAHARMLEAHFPRVELIEAASEPALVAALTRAIERLKPAEARLVRLHEWLWLRMWSHLGSPAEPDRDSIRDLICSIGAP